MFSPVGCVCQNRFEREVKQAISEVFVNGKQVRKCDVSCGKPPLLSVISAQKSKKITKCAQNKMVLKQDIGAKNDTTRYKTIQNSTKLNDTFL